MLADLMIEIGNGKVDPKKAKKFLRTLSPKKLSDMVSKELEFLLSCQDSKSIASDLCRELILEYYRPEILTEKETRHIRKILLKPK